MKPKDLAPKDGPPINPIVDKDGNVDIDTTDYDDVIEAELKRRGIAST